MVGYTSTRHEGENDDQVTGNAANEILEVDDLVPDNNALRCEGYEDAAIMQTVSFERFGNDLQRIDCRWRPGPRPDNTDFRIFESRCDHPRNICEVS